MNDETAGMTNEQIKQFERAEVLILEWKKIGAAASDLLYEARAGISGIDWFDHRHHLLNPSIEFNDFWAESGCNVLRKMKLGAEVIDLCCGDGFYDYHFFRHRARSIVGIDINRAAIALARREHSARNIEYIVGDVLDYKIDKKCDIAVCRGAIEHFEQDEQNALFRKVAISLNSGGWFCGDTVITDGSNDAHKHEWMSEEQMRDALGLVFSYIESNTIVSANRVTLQWSAQV